MFGAWVLVVGPFDVCPESMAVVAHKFTLGHFSDQHVHCQVFNFVSLRHCEEFYGWVEMVKGKHDMIPILTRQVTVSA